MEGGRDGGGEEMDGRRDVGEGRTGGGMAGGKVGWMEGRKDGGTEEGTEEGTDGRLEVGRGDGERREGS